MSELDSLEALYRDQLAIKTKTLVRMMRELSCDLSVSAKNLERNVTVIADSLVEEAQARGMEIDRCCIERQALMDAIGSILQCKGRNCE